jgi:hypothetical protein
VSATAFAKWKSVRTRGVDARGRFSRRHVVRRGANRLMEAPTGSLG